MNRCFCLPEQYHMFTEGRVLCFQLLCFWISQIKYTKYTFKYIVKLSCKLGKSSSHTCVYAHGLGFKVVNCHWSSAALESLSIPVTSRVGFRAIMGDQAQFPQKMESWNREFFIKVRPTKGYILNERIEQKKKSLPICNEEK